MTHKKHKLSVNKTQITAAARRALMVADTNYFSWSAQQQEHFRATMDKASRNRVQRVLLDNLLGIKCSSGESDDAWNDVPLTKLDVLNGGMLLATGIGDDFIYLNESMADDKTLLDFTTLYDYNYDDYLYQQQARKEDSPSYKGQDYYAYQHPSWVRLLIEDQFYYATFLSLATHINNEMTSIGDDHMQQLIPYKFVDGKDNGKAEKGGFRWDKKLDAGGLEGQLDELKTRWYDYQHKRWLELSKANCKLTSTVYTQDTNWDIDPNRHFIFTNEATLKKIRWRHFLADCKPMMADITELEERQEQENSRALSFLDDSYQDIMANYDPNVVKLRKKRKIIMTPNAMEDLDRIGHEDESAD